MAQLDWQIKENKLYLSGDLETQSVLGLWQQRATILTETLTSINVANLSRVDSAGLALLVSLNFSSLGLTQLKLEGVSNALQMLLELYNLRQLTDE